MASRGREKTNLPPPWISPYPQGLEMGTTTVTEGPKAITKTHTMNTDYASATSVSTNNAMSVVMAGIALIIQAY